LILTKVLPTNETWGPLSRFPDVFVMKGNAALPHSLLAAGVKRCAKVVVVVTSNLAARGLETDAEALLIGKNIQGDLQQLFTVIEISMCPSLSLFSGEESNIEFLSPLTSTWEGRMNRTRSLLNDNTLLHEKRSKLVNLGRRGANKE